jgi:hypothetical protein
VHRPLAAQCSISIVIEQQRRTADGANGRRQVHGRSDFARRRSPHTFAAQYPNQIPARQQFAKRFSRPARTYDKPALRNTQPLLYFRSKAAT